MLPTFKTPLRLMAAHPRLRPAPLLLAVQLALATAFAITVSPVHAEVVAVRQYNIPAGPLAEALNRFAQQAGVALVVDANAVSGLRSPGLSGSYGVVDGFELLLRGSGFAAVDQGNGDYLLQAVKTDAAAVTLAPVKVTSYEPLNAGVSGNRSVITSDDIEVSQAGDLGDLFRNTPSVAVGGSLGIAEKIYVRGLEDALLNVSIDGATQAGVLFHHTGRLSVEPELLKQVDVHAGAGLATDGPGALGGSIRFVTKDPEDMLRDGERVGALLKAGYYDNTEGYKVNANLFGRITDNWSGLVSLSQADGNDITDGDGNELVGTESEQQMGFAKIVGRLTEDQMLRLSHEQRRDDGVRAQRPQWVISSWNPGYPLESRRRTTTLNYQWSPASRWLDLDATLYKTRSEIEQDVFNRWGVYNGGSESIGGDLHNTLQLGRHALTVGVDYRRDEVNAGPEGYENEQKEKGNVTGYYVQDLWQITDVLLFSAGARYDLYELDDNLGQRFESEGLSPNVGASYQLTPQLSLNAAYAEALRGRTTTETFLLDSRSNSPDLEPEEARNTEIGFEYRRDALAVSGTAYRARIDNAINDQARLFQNIGDIETNGYDLRISYDWSRLQAGLTYSNYDSELVDAGTRLDLNAYDHGALGNTIGTTWMLDIAWQLNDAWRFGWNSRVVESIDDIDTSAGTIDQPGYAVHDIYARWQATPDLTLTLTVLNLFDKYYVDHATNASFEHIPGYEGVIGLAEPGRDMRLSAAWRW